MKDYKDQVDLHFPWMLPLTSQLVDRARETVHAPANPCSFGCCFHVICHVAFYSSGDVYCFWKIVHQWIIHTRNVG